MEAVDMAIHGNCPCEHMKCHTILEQFFGEYTLNYAHVSANGLVTCESCRYSETPTCAQAYTAGQFISHFIHVHLQTRPTVTPQQPYCSMCGRKVFYVHCSPERNEEIHNLHMYECDKCYKFFVKIYANA